MKNSTHLAIEGIFLGNKALWRKVIDMSGATETTPITQSTLGNSVKEMTFSEAMSSTADWKGEMDPATMMLPYRGEERTYFKYKSLFLFEPLPEEAIQILIEEATYFEENYKSTQNKVVFEFQALGGDPGKPAGDDDGGYPNWSPQNLFAAVGPKDTAFPHRGALHCLTLKSEAFMLVSGGLATRLLGRMEGTFAKISPFVRGGASYYNYVDPNLPPGVPYFRNGVELNPGVTAEDADYWMDRLRETKGKYNPDDMLSNPLGIGGVPSSRQNGANGSANPSAGTSIYSNGLVPSVIVIVLTGYFLLQSTQSASIFLQDASWRRKRE